MKTASQLIDPEILRQWMPIGISLLSLLLASVALGWNFYRDVILKARVRVTFAIVRLVTPGQPVGSGSQHLKIEATNHGPGPVKVQMMAGQQSPLWRRLVRQPQHFVILNDHTNPLNPKLPHRLEVGDSLALLLPYNIDCFLKDRPTHIGVTDSFGRVHYARGSDLRKAIRLYRDDFPGVNL